MMLLKAGQIASDEISTGFLERSDERLIDKIKEYSEECKSLALDKERAIEDNLKINRRVYGKNDLKKKSTVEVKGARTNADVILDKIKRDYN